jgi:hypothetical protein
MVEDDCSWIREGCPSTYSAPFVAVSEQGCVLPFFGHNHELGRRRRVFVLAKHCKTLWNIQMTLSRACDGPPPSSPPQTSSCSHRGIHGSAKSALWALILQDVYHPMVRQAPPQFYCDVSRELDLPLQTLVTVARLPLHTVSWSISQEARCRLCAPGFPLN